MPARTQDTKPYSRSVVIIGLRHLEHPIACWLQAHVERKLGNVVPIRVRKRRVNDFLHRAVSTVYTVDKPHAIPDQTTRDILSERTGVDTRPVGIGYPVNIP